jgi:hypothetical protein
MMACLNREFYERKGDFHETQHYRKEFCYRRSHRARSGRSAYGEGRQQGML